MPFPLNTKREDCCAVFGLKPDASMDEIKQAYVMQLNEYKEAAKKDFALIQEAYSTLSDLSVLEHHNNLPKNAPAATPVLVPTPIVKKVEIFDPSKPEGEELSLVEVVEHKMTPFAKTSSPFDY